MKLKYLVLPLLLLLMLIGCSNNPDVKAPNYNVFEEKAKGKVVYLRVETDALSEKDLQLIVLDIAKKYNNNDSMFVYITYPGPKNHDNVGGYNPAIMTSKVAFTKKGLAQTGLQEINKPEYEYIGKQQDSGYKPLDEKTKKSIQNRINQ